MTAQVTTGNIVGTVIDNQKGVVPGVTITVTGPALIGSRTVVTEADGTYRVPNLPPGEGYTLVFEMPGFSTITRKDIALGIGFTATVNIELSLAGMAENVTVSGSSPVVDVTATKVTSDMNAAKMADVMGSRDYTMLLSSVPGITLARMDVGGSNSINNIGYVAYGLSNGNRGEVEGMYTSENATGSSDMNYSNFNSFEEFAVTAVGNGADMPKPGNLSSVVSKSGGNVYHGSVYQDYENKNMESHNIDAEQIARGVKGGGNVATEDVNRLDNTNDFSVDLGGFVKKDKLWWYAAYRHQHQAQNYAVLIDATAHIDLPIRSFKVTYNLSQNNKLVGYYTRGTKFHDNYSIPTTIINSASLTNEVYPTGTYSVAWDSVLKSSVLVVRAGNWYDRSWYIGKCDQIPDGRGGVGVGQCATRYNDTGANLVNGTATSTIRGMDRPQVNGSLTYFKDGWAGSHNFKIGGEYMYDTTFSSTPVYNNIVLTLNNGVPTQAQIYQPMVRSLRSLQTLSGYAQDSWRINSRMTVNYGLRLDHYHSYSPVQTGIQGHEFPQIDGAKWNNPGPRLGVVYALSDDQKTLIKANYGQYWENPGSDFSGDYTANATANFSTYVWTDTNPTYEARPQPTADPRGVPIFNPANLGRLISTTGTLPDFTAAVTVDPNLKNSTSRQALVYFEREVANNFGMRTGVVWNGLRQQRATINVNQPFDAFTVPTVVTSPGADNIAGTSDDISLTAYGLDAAHLALAPKQVIMNQPSLDSDYYTWEVTANRRQTGWWSLLGTFSETWSRAGISALTPNALINSNDGKNNSTRWNAKIQATLEAPYGIRLLPIWRHQSGDNFGATFTGRLNYSANVSIKAEPNDTKRLDNNNLVDLRTEKTFSTKIAKLGPSKVGVFLDLYNIFNSNVAQSVTTAYGATYLRPTVITGPRIMRIGARLTF